MTGNPKWSLDLVLDRDVEYRSGDDGRGPSKLKRGAQVRLIGGNREEWIVELDGQGSGSIQRRDLPVVNDLVRRHEERRTFIDREPAVLGHLRKWLDAQVDLALTDLIDAAGNRLADARRLAEAGGRWWRGEPSGELAFVTMMETVMAVRGGGYRPTSEFGRSDYDFDSFPGFRNPCLMSRDLLEPIFFGVVAYVSNSAERSKVSFDELISHAGSALDRFFAPVDRLQHVLQVAGGLKAGGSPQDLNASTRLLTEDDVERSHSPHPGLRPILPDLCRMERANITERLVRCFCRDNYRIDRIVAENRRDLSGGELVGEACPEDLVVLHGLGFGDKRDWSIGTYSSRVLFQTLGGGDAEAQEYLEWSDDRVVVRLPPNAVSGRVNMEILCDVDMECGILTKPPSAFGDRHLTMIPDPFIASFNVNGETDSTKAVICAASDIDISVEEAEEVTISDDRGETLEFPAGLLGDRRTVRGVLTVDETEDRTYTMIARNGCASAQADYLVERTADDWITAVPAPARARPGQTVDIIVRLSCTPQRLGLDGLTVDLAVDREKIVDPEETTLFFGPVDQEQRIVAKISACGRARVEPAPRDLDDHPIVGSASYSQRIIAVSDEPKGLSVRAPGGACGGPMRLTADCLAAFPDEVRLWLRNQRTGSVRELEVESLETDEDAVGTLRTTLPELGSDRWQLEYEVTTGMSPLTVGPIPLGPFEYEPPRIVAIDPAVVRLNTPHRPQSVTLDWSVRFAERVELRRGSSELLGLSHPNPFKGRCGSESWDGLLTLEVAGPRDLEFLARGPGGATDRTVSLRTPCLRVHLKYLIPKSLKPPDAQFRAIRQVFGQYGLEVTDGTVEVLPLPQFADLSVEGNCDVGSVSPEQRTLYSNRNMVAGREIVVYFVRNLIGANTILAGCAQQASPDRPACAVALDASVWATCHEIGHVLGLRHFAGHKARDRSLLMHQYDDYINVPPDLNGSELDKVSDSLTGGTIRSCS